MPHSLSKTSPGFTLLEVLIALFVLAIGVLGIGSLQLQTLASTHEAYLKSVSSIQATDLEERMRANLAGLEDYLGIGDNGSLVSVASLVPRKMPANCQSSAGCDSRTLATYDIERWATTTANLFPATLMVGLEQLSGINYKLTLRWTSPEREGQESEQQLAYYFQMGDV